MRSDRAAPTPAPTAPEAADADPTSVDPSERLVTELQADEHDANEAVVKRALEAYTAILDVFGK